MQLYKISKARGLPVVAVILSGPKFTKKLKLIFDSGTLITQIHIGMLNSLGYDFSSRTPDMKYRGVTGEAENGYTIQTSNLFIFGKRFQNHTIGAFDFNKWANEGFDGLLGWDIIEKLRFEVDGPNNSIKVF